MKKLTGKAILFGLLLTMLTSACTAPASQTPQLSVSTPQPTQTPPVADLLPQHGGTLVIANGAGIPRHFNPALISGSPTILIGTQIFASPLRYDENWNPQPYLAERWEIADDGLSVTLHLVKGATFHDGAPITSEDVAFSLFTVKQNHPFKTMFAPVTGVETPDPLTAIIRLSKPHPAILLAMSPALLPILPKHIYGDGQDLLTHPANLTPVGSGPFKFMSYDPGKTLVLDRYENFFIEDRPYLDKIIFRFLSEPNAQIIDLLRQEAHIAPNFTDFSGLNILSANENLIVTSQGYEGLGPINWLAFNLLHPPLDDKSVRQAIAYSIDTDFIIKFIHQGKSKHAQGPITPDSPFYEPNIPKYEVDLEKANQLLDEAGYPRGSDGTRFSLTLDYIPLVPSQQHDVAYYIQHQLKKVGINVIIHTSADLSEWISRVSNWDFDMTMDLVYNWGDPVIGVNRTYVCDNNKQGAIWTNTQNYCNPEVDEILTQAAQEMDPVKRKALYSDFQFIVADELPILWINSVPYYTIYNQGLGNPPISIWGMHSPLDELYWINPPERNYANIPTLTGDESLVKKTGINAIALIQEKGLYDALEVFQDPLEGFLDTGESGLHVLGVTRQGKVFLDNSGQISPGMDITGIQDDFGNPILTIFLNSATPADGTDFQSEGIWPNPNTNKVSPMSGWCGNLSENDVICAIVWQNNAGGDE